MSLQDLTPVSTQRAKQASVNAFMKFLATEDISMEFLSSVVQQDNNGTTLVKVLDHFGLYLAFRETAGAQRLAKNSVMNYFRGAKNGLLEKFPQQRPLVNEALLKQARVLERYCLKRVDGGIVNKAPACTKKDLKTLVSCRYAEASSSKEYQDAAMLSLTWFTFGRASDLGFVHKYFLSVCSENVLFVRLIRTKTSEEQGISLFPDHTSFETCPIHAIGVALAMQSIPAVDLLDQPILQQQTEENIAGTAYQIPLIELLNGEAQQERDVEASSRAKAPSSMKIHAYVNRVLKPLSAKLTNITSDLASHSFRRGGAQHANSCPDLSPQWIFDRGSWNMTAPNKAFAYLFNTTSEDQRVSKVLSGWEVNAKPQIATTSIFDSSRRERVQTFAKELFKSSTCFSDQKMRLNAHVVDVLAGSVITLSRV